METSIQIGLVHAISAVECEYNRPRFSSTCVTRRQYIADPTTFASTKSKANVSRSGFALKAVV